MNRAIARGVPGLLALGLLLSGCAHWVNVPVMVPARKALPGVKSIAVADFQDQTPLAQNMRLGSQISSGIHGGIAQAKVLEIQRMGMSGEDRSLVAGAPAGVDAVLTGSVRQAEVVDTAPVKKVLSIPQMVDGNMVMVNVEMVEIVRSARLNIEYRLLRVPNGATVCSDSAARDAALVKTGETPEKTVALFPPPESMIAPMLPGIVGQFVTDLSPQTVEVRRRLLKGDDKCKLGNQSADRRLWDEAQLYWEESSTTAEDPDDRAAAFYNLAVYYEVQANFEKAREALGEARTLLPEKTLFMEYQTLINERESQFQAVERQREIMETPQPPN